MKRVSFPLAAAAAFLGWTGSAQALPPEVACYVETPALDQFTRPVCSDSHYSVGTTTAVFEVFNLAAGVAYTLDWDHAGCIDDEVQCVLPIASSTVSGSMINVTVTVTNLATSEMTVTSVRARNLVDP